MVAFKSQINLWRNNFAIPEEPELINRNASGSRSSSGCRYLNENARINPEPESIAGYVRAHCPEEQPLPVFQMLEAKRLLAEVVNSLRNVIGPAIADPYPRSQAYMAAVILEFISHQVEDRSDLASVKQRALTDLFDDLLRSENLAGMIEADGADLKARLCNTIETIHAAREEIGPRAFESANRRIRSALRQLLDADLKVATSKKD